MQYNNLFFLIACNIYMYGVDILYLYTQYEQYSTYIYIYT